MPRRSWSEDHLHIACDARAGVAEVKHEGLAPAPRYRGCRPIGSAAACASSCCNRVWSSTARACSFAALAESSAA
jgi:hypothetical protein